MPTTSPTITPTAAGSATTAPRPAGPIVTPAAKKAKTGTARPAEKLLRRGWTNPVLLAVPALLVWGLVHASGVHATVAGVLLGPGHGLPREVVVATQRGEARLALRADAAGFPVLAAAPLLTALGGELHVDSGWAEVVELPCASPLPRVAEPMTDTRL